MTIENIYNVFRNNDFCEAQDIIFRVHVYNTYDDYEENALTTYRYEQSEKCECIRYAELYHNENKRNELFTKYAHELECSSIVSATTDTIYIDCDYVVESI